MGKVRIEKGENTVSILNQIGVLAWPYPNKDTMIELNSPFSARFRFRSPTVSAREISTYAPSSAAQCIAM